MPPLPPAQGPKRVDVVYVGAPDCFYCEHWEAARRPELLAALRGTRARFVEIHGASLREPVTERDFPAELRWLHREVGDLRGVPQFFLLIDGKIALRVYGTSAYSSTFVPRLERALAEAR
jgi:hypothetical protein